MEVTFKRECQEVSLEFENIFGKNQACVVRIDNHYGLIDPKSQQKCLIEFTRVEKLSTGFIFERFDNHFLCFAKQVRSKEFIFSPNFAEYEALDGYLIVHTRDGVGYFIDTDEYDELMLLHWEDVVGNDDLSDVFCLPNDEGCVIVNRNFETSKEVYMDEASLVSEDVPNVRIMLDKDQQVVAVNVTTFREFSNLDIVSFNVFFSTEKDGEKVVATNYLQLVSTSGKEALLRISDMQISCWCEEVLILSEENDFAYCKKDESHSYFLRLSDFKVTYFDE